MSMSSSSTSRRGRRDVSLTPQLDEESTRVLNLTVLQRSDPHVEEILMTASHVTLYHFNIDRSQWSRKDVEGSLFVVKRSLQPIFQFVVMNRRSTENLVENLLGDFEFELQVPYLLYRNAHQEVNGIWFYNPPECHAVANLFNRILTAFSKLPPKTQPSTLKGEFEELEASSNLSVVEGPSEPQTSASASGPDVSEDSLVNLFTAALNGGNASNPKVSSGYASTSTTISVAPNQFPLPETINQAATTTVLSALQKNAHLPTSSTPQMPLVDTLEQGVTGHATNLLKPSFFAPLQSSPLMMPPAVSASLPAAPPLQPPAHSLQGSYRATLLQPFPPPAPTSSLASASNYAPVISRDKVRDALVRLAQNDKFIDMVYREINSNYS